MHADCKKLEQGASFLGLSHFELHYILGGLVAHTLLHSEKSHPHM